MFVIKSIMRRVRIVPIKEKKGRNACLHSNYQKLSLKRVLKVELNFWRMP